MVPISGIPLFDKNVNFGYAYLANAQQDVVLTSELLKNNFSNFNDTENSVKVSDNYGILYYYGVDANISASDEISSLKNYNTISFNDLFNVRGELANSIYVNSSNSTIVSVNSTSLTVLGVTGNNTITLTIGSKQNYNIKPITIQVLVVNYISSFDVILENYKLVNNENISIQIGNDFAKKTIL